jgi:site-specific DNA-methyltransferase (adenine-specific)
MGIRPVADFETLNYQIMTDLNTSTEVTITDETAIGFIPCYRLPFLSLFHADCMEIMKQYPDKHFDLAIVDPPYGIGDFNQSDSKYSKIEWNNSVPTNEYFTELNRVSKEQIVWGANYYNCFQNGAAIVWYKENPHPSLSQAEIASLSIGKKVHYVKVSHQKTITKENKNNRIHPCQKPVDLYDWQIRQFATKGMKILDTHFGSGSIALAVDRVNRLDKMNLHLTACEIDKEYINKAIKRISESIKQGALSF